VKLGVEKLEQVKVRSIPSGGGDRMTPHTQFQSEDRAQARGRQQIWRYLATLNPPDSRVRQADE
jgi:hypothetical protein